MMAALDHVDGVDLHIAEMGDRISDGPCALAERRARSSRWARSQICRACFVGSGRGFGARDIAGGNVAGFAPRKEPEDEQRNKEKPRCHLLTARLDIRAEAYFIIIAFCAFM